MSCLSYFWCEQVKFKYPSEYLIQVKGSTSTKVPRLANDIKGEILIGRNLGRERITSLTFITNKATYGPYDLQDPNSAAFCSEPARVVGFFGVDEDDRFESIGVLTVPL